MDQKSQNGGCGCLPILAGIGGAILLGLPIIAISECSKSSEQKQKEQSDRFERERHEQWQKGQDVKDENFRQLYKAAQDMDRYKKQHGHYPGNDE